MSRNSGGTYTLPAGNPVVSGTTIDPTVQNNTMNDVATELTNSLDRGGRGAMTGQLQLANGTVAAPAVAFGADTNTGIYRVGADDMGLAVNGTLTAEYATTGVSLPRGLTVTQAQTNTGGITATGNGSGIGATITGGATGVGISASGGATSGTAILAQGTGAGGAGISAAGTSASNGGHGVSATAQGATPLDLLQLGTTHGHLSFNLLSSAPSGPAKGELYVDNNAVLWICTNATGPVWTKVGTQT